MSRRAWLPLAGVGALALGGCSGPSDTDIAGAVVAASPVAYGVGLGLVRLLTGQHRRHRPDLEFGDPAVLGATAAMLVLLGLWGLASADVELIPLALIIYGSSVLTLWLASWRIAVSNGARRPVVGTGLAVMAITTLPAVVTLIFADGHLPTEDVLAVGAILWFYAGGFGVLGWVMFIGLAIEGALRRPPEPYAEFAVPVPRDDEPRG